MFGHGSTSELLGKPAVAHVRHLMFITLFGWSLQDGHDKLRAALHLLNVED